MVMVVVGLMGAAAGTSNMLVGAAAPISPPPDGCRAVGSVAPDAQPEPAGIALQNVDYLPLPHVGHAFGAIRVGTWSYTTASGYARALHPLQPDPVERAMGANGFVAGASALYDGDPTTYNLAVFQFASGAKAASFQEQSLREACGDGLITNVEPLGSHAGGFTYTAHGTALVVRATFLVGDSVVRLGLCVCIPYGVHPISVVSLWADDVDARFRVPPPQ